MRIRFFFRWYDLWVGLYIDRAGHAVYLCPLPCLGLHITWRPRLPLSLPPNAP